MDANIAKNVIKIESKAVAVQIKHIDGNFSKAAALITKCKGRTIIMGLGKSGLVGRKISATMSSIGIPSMFLHPAESLHGDLGMIVKGDIVIMLSYSGETEEIKKVMPILAKMQIPVIVMTGRVKSAVWEGAFCIINCSVEKEACPYNLAPTASTTAMLALGDALALTVSNAKGFKREDLAVLHPLGAIGKTLTMRVSDIMRKGKDIPIVFETADVKETMLTMTSSATGAAIIINKKGKLIGFFTDGDLRRKLQSGANVLNENISKVMTKNPVTATPDMMAVEAGSILKKYKIDNIPVVDKNNKPIGILDQGDILAEGLI